MIIKLKSRSVFTTPIVQFMMYRTGLVPISFSMIIFGEFGDRNIFSGFNFRSMSIWPYFTLIKDDKANKSL